MPTLLPPNSNPLDNQDSVPVSPSDLGVLQQVSPMTDTGTFRLEATGELSPVVGAKPTPVDEWTTTQGPINPQFAASSVLLALHGDVDSAEVEALAVSLWEDAGWTGPGKLTLTGPASLSGPWSVSREVARGLGLRMGLDQAFLLSCPVVRGTAIPPELRGHNHLMEAFLPGPPERIELDIINGLNAIARRLNGSLRIPDTGYCHTPDPDSAVSLSVLTDQIADPIFLQQLLSKIPIDFKIQLAPPDLFAPPGLGGIPGAGGLADVNPDYIPPSVDGVSLPYNLTGGIGNHSQIMIDVHKAQVVPASLRWEQWADPQTLMRYRIDWLPPVPLYMIKSLNRSQRRERLRASKLIEGLAAMLLSALGGAILDEDDFLVAL